MAGAEAINSAHESCDNAVAQLCNPAMVIPVSGREDSHAYLIATRSEKLAIPPFKLTT
jgi:hypothetical protein